MKIRTQKINVNKLIPKFINLFLFPRLVLETYSRTIAMKNNSMEEQAIELFFIGIKRNEFISNG